MLAGPGAWTLVLGVDDVTRDSARHEAERELTKPEYHHTPPLLIRLLTWVWEKIQTVLGKAADAAPGGAWGLVGLVVLIALLLVALRWRYGAVAAAARHHPVFGGSRLLTAAEHRAAAERAAGVGDWGTAIRERFRAVVRALEERTLLEPRLGRTADEAAEEAAGALPSAAALLRAAAVAFDDVAYGGRTPSEGGYAAVAEADHAAAGSAPVLT